MNMTKVYSVNRWYSIVIGITFSMLSFILFFVINRYSLIWPEVVEFTKLYDEFIVSHLIEYIYLTVPFFMFFLYTMYKMYRHQVDVFSKKSIVISSLLMLLPLIVLIMYILLFTIDSEFLIIAACWGISVVIFNYLYMTKVHSMFDKYET